MAQFEIVEVKTFVVGHRDPTETGGSRSIVAMSSSGTKIAGDSVHIYSAGTKPGTAVNDQLTRGQDGIVQRIAETRAILAQLEQRRMNR